MEKRLWLIFLLLFFFGTTRAQNEQDTVISKIHYAWVKYDLNRTPTEIGQFNNVGIKNGKMYKENNVNPRVIQNL